MGAEGQGGIVNTVYSQHEKSNPVIFLIVWNTIPVNSIARKQEHTSMLIHGGEGKAIVKLSITAESLHLGP